MKSLPLKLTVIPGGEVYFRKVGRGYSYIRHTRRDCPRLARSEVREVREIDLWPGFICEICRDV